MFRRTANGAVRFCVRAGIHPDVVSYLSMVFAAGAGACFLLARRYPWLLLIAPLLCYGRLWMNMLDGMVALASGKASRRGEILNELPDRISDVIIFAGVAHSGMAHLTLAYWAAIAALMTAYVGTLGQAVASRREFGGVMAKPIRMVVLHIGAWLSLALILSGRAARLGPLSILDYACLIVIVGCVQTIAVRLLRTFRLLEEQTMTTTTTDIESATVAIETGSQHTFESYDGTKLFYRAWVPQTPATRAVILLHRGHEHSGRLCETVRRLALDDTCVFAWDQRGHGRSPGERGGAENVAQLARDLDTFVHHLAHTHGIRVDQTALIAHSVGAVIAATWVHDYAPPVCGMALLAPAFDVKLYVPLAIPALRIKRALLGPCHVKSYVRSRVLTHDRAEQQAYDADELIFRQIAVNLLLDLHDTSKRIVADAGAITTPALILAAGRDWVVNLDTQEKFHERLSSSVKQLEVFPEMYHALLHEKDRHVVVDRVRRFILECFERPVAHDALVDSDRGGYTRTEYDRLRMPASGLANTKWKLVRRFLRIGAYLSDGIRLGFASGFDSGMTLDYVYANRPRGFTPLGRLIDHLYLNSIGWRGIRQRRVHLEKLLHQAIEQTHAENKPVRILDIAAGAGRYVLSTMASSEVPCTALLRDYRQANLDAAKALASELKLDSRVEFELGDAFDRASLASIAPKPTIEIISGLFELFPDNAPLRQSLLGLADAVEPGGYLLYTCQPWHPQIEFIARALPNREGQPWIMRRRTQAEMDGLVRASGFEKVSQEIDRWGIFTVCLARRI
jgi:alpha-beta hydrolase superfamily lysophospholipase/phosphatidylglycerophosphate synthase/SAM-dependent methyltransferase